MAYGTLLTSARDQWFQSTWAVLPNGNWDAGGQHICILDNGEVWMHMTRVNSFFSAYPFDPGFTTNPQESEWKWIGKVHPTGCERVSGDELCYGAEPGGVSNSFGFPYPKTTDHFLPESGFCYRGSYSVDGTLVTDGEFIYIFQGELPNSGRYPKWFKLDPATYEFEHIAGGPDTTGSLTGIDDPVGINASMWEPGQCVYYEGYIYWVDRGEHSNLGFNSQICRVRRMSLTAPYGVETVTPDLVTPAGYPGIDSGGFAWFDQINSATGLPNVFNDDVLSVSGSSTGIVGMQIYDGYFYFMTRHDAISYDYQYIKRKPLAGGPMELLFYGWGRRNSSNVPNDHRDNMVDGLERPTGAKHQTQNIWYSSNIYTPDLEGWSYEHTTILITPDGTLFATNWAGGFFGTGNDWGIRIVKFSIADLVANYELHGPQQVNREDPQWDTLVNGTAFWEGTAHPGKRFPTVYSFGIPQDNPFLRMWSGRDGNTPLISHVLTTGWTFNWNVPEFEGKIMFVHPEISDSVGALTIGSSATNNAMMVALLQPSGGEEMTLHLNFEGIALKGYGAAPGMPQAWAPEEVTLT